MTFHPKFQNIFDKLEDNKGDVKPIKTEMTASETVTENVSNEPTSASNSSVTESSVTKDETVDGQSVSRRGGRVEKVLSGQKQARDGEEI